MLKKIIVPLIVIILIEYTFFSSLVFSQKSKHDRELELINLQLLISRIYDKSGQYDKSLEILRELKSSYPSNREIIFEYLDVMIRGGRYEEAKLEIDKELKKTPSDTRMLLIKARLHYETNETEELMPVYSEIIKTGGYGPDLISDIGYSAIDNGEWSLALTMFLEAFEADQSNENAEAMIIDILQNYKPAFGVNYRYYENNSEKSYVNSYGLSYRSFVTENLAVKLETGHRKIFRKETGGLVKIDSDLTEGIVSFSHTQGGQWNAETGFGGFDGLGDGKTWFGGLMYNINEKVSVGGKYTDTEPWYDPVEAAANDGYQDEYNLNLKYLTPNGTGFKIEGGEIRYHLGTSGEYGDKEYYLAEIFRRFSETPYLSIGYRYYISEFSYKNDSSRVVSMVDKERSHSPFLYSELDYSNKIQIIFSTGAGRDTKRPITTWYINPGIKFRKSNRTDAELSYQYSSDSGNVDEGSTQVFTIRGNLIF